LKREEISLRVCKTNLGIINEALLDPTFPVQIIYPESWEMKEEVEEFQKLSDIQKRSFIEQRCAEDAEKVRTIP
jgi:hypothetical protein